MKAVHRFVRDFPFLPWLSRKTRTPPLISVDDPDLRVVVRAFDETRAASSALDGAESWRPGDPAVLRHHVRLPAGGLESARAVLESEGWTLRTGEPGDDQGKPEDDHAGSANRMISVRALRVQQLDALHCSQESSRMAGLAQRLGGTSLGWDALQQQGSGPAATTDYSSGGRGG